MMYGVKSLLTAALAAICGMGTTAIAFELAVGQRPPLKLLSIGDSLTRGTNAYFIGDNLDRSWSNGDYGFWARLFHLPNVNSHNQRITAAFGSSGRRNLTVARNGARVKHWAEQAAAAPLHEIDYVTAMLGGNDVCRDSVFDLPTDAEFEAHVRDGLTTLLDGLPLGGSVLVVAIPNARALYDLGKSKTALGITSCPTLWKLTGSCEAVLSKNATELDRAYIQSRNIGYNDILADVTGEIASSYPGKFVRFSPAGYELPSAEEHISNLDCFHASARGQRELAERTWPPFAQPAE